MALRAQGSITIRRRPKDGNPGADAVRYWLVPSATQIKKTDDGKFYPSTITCEKRKQTGNSSPIATSEGNLKYQICYKDNSVSTATIYSSAITIPANCQWIKFTLYVNSIDVATETVSVVCDGEDVFLIDLDNEMQGIPCNSSGTPTGSGTLASTNITVYKGASIDTGWTFTKVDSGCTSSIKNNTVSVSAITADKASVTITATKNSKTLTAVMSLYKVKAGADGANGTDGSSPVIYSIETSASAISRNASGTLSPSSINAYKNKTIGNVTTRTKDKTLKYKREGQDNSEITLSNEGGEIKDINSACTAITLKIYDTDGSTILDSERIPIVKDGQNGKDGEDGKNGKDGENGKNGEDGKDGKDGEDGADAVRYWLVPSATAVNRNTSGTYSPNKISCSLMKQIGGSTPTSISSMFIRYKIEYTGFLMMNWTKYTPGTEITIGSYTRNIKFELYATGTTPSSGDATGNGVCIDTVTIPIVIDGSNGSNGSNGLQGCIVRITEWNEGVEYHNDEALTSGTRFLDIAIITTGVTTFEAYKCLQTHTASSANAPGNATYWSKFNSMAPIYSPMIMAQYAILRIAQANQIQVMKEDDTTVNAALGGGKYPLWIGANQPQQAKFYVDDTGKAYMQDAEIVGRIIAGVVDGQRVELQPENKAMKIYNKDGNEVASYEGNSYTSLSSLFSNVSGSFTMNDNKKGALSLAGNDTSTQRKDEEYTICDKIYSSTPIELIVSGFLKTSHSNPPSYQGSGSGSGTTPTKPQLMKSASANLALNVVTYSDAALKNKVANEFIAAISGNNEKSFTNLRIKTSVGGYHVIKLWAILSATGKDMNASAQWGSQVSGKADISATYTSDFYVSRYFGNGFCLGQSTSNYIWAYNQGTSGMRFIMENSGFGLDVSNSGIKIKHHSGNWVSMPLFVFKGMCVYDTINNTGYGLTYAKSFNGVNPSISRQGTGHIRLTYPDTWKNLLSPSANNLIVNVVGYGTISGGSNPIKANIKEITTTHIDIVLSDDASANDGWCMINISFLS